MARSTNEWLLGTAIVLSVMGAASVALAISVAQIDWHPKAAVAEEAPPWSDPRDELNGLALGEYLFDTFACRTCHGPGGTGGVINPNYLQETNPALNVLAERLMLFDEDDAALASELLAAGRDPAELSSEPPFRTYGRFTAQLTNVRHVIRDGSIAGKADPNGPPPNSMPAWGPTLDDREIDAVIAYLITLYPWDDG